MKKTSLFLLLGLAACGSEKSSGSPATGQPANPNAVVNPGTGVVEPNSTIPSSDPNMPMATSPNAVSFDEVGAASYTLPTAASYTGPNIVRSGRMVASGANYQFNWAGTSFTARPAATSVTINVTVPNATATSSQYFDVFVDGKLQALPVTLVAGTTAYPLTLPDTNPHTVTWVLRTEANYGTGVLTFTGITATGGTLTPTATPDASPRQVEFIGDSITNGYGARSLSHSPVLGRDSGCTVDGTYVNYKQDSSTESADLSFAAIASHTLNAQYALVASAGRGVYRNGSTTADVAGTATPTMSTLYPYTLHPYASDITGTTISGTIPAWDAAAATAAAWQPQVVVLNLGTNDFSKHGTDATNANNEAFPVSTSSFQTAYSALLTKVHGIYPSAKIIPMVGPMLTTQNDAIALAAVKAAIQATDPTNSYVMAPLDVGPQPVLATTDTGCEYHPLPATHAAVAKKVVTAIQAAVPGWM